MNGFIALKKSKQYVEDTLQGQGALKGEKGDAGVSITSVSKTSTSGLTDTYTIAYSDGTSSTFDVVNGANITKLSQLANDEKFITNAVDNLLNYYSKEDINQKIDSINGLSFETVTTLPLDNISVSTVYLVNEVENVYSQYMYIDNSWASIGKVTDMSDYYTKTETNELLGDKADKTELHTHSNQTDVLDLLGKDAEGNLTYNGAKIDTTSDLSGYYTKEETDGLLDSKANNTDLHSHTNQDSVLNKLSAIDGKLAFDGVAVDTTSDLSGYYTSDEVDGFLADKADSTDLHTHANSEILGKLSASESGELLYDNAEITDLSNYYDKTETDNLLNGKANSATVTTHVNNAEIHLDTDLKAKINKAHTHENSDVLAGITQENVEDWNSVPDWAKSINKPTYTASEVGLGNVDNTSDIDKPVSTAQDTAIKDSLKEAKDYTDTSIKNLVGAAPETLNTLEELATAIGDNADLIDTLDSAITNKADSSALTAHTSDTVAHTTQSEKTKWDSAYSHIEDTTKHITSEERTAWTKITNKVDKIEGKSLSTNDYTTEEKEKLRDIAENANNYSHPTYTSAESGLYKVSVDETGHVNSTTIVTKSDITSLGIPESDTTYEVVTTEVDGLMSSADKTKLNSIEENANNYEHPAYDTVKSGMYKVSVDETGHVATTETITKEDISVLGIATKDEVKLQSNGLRFASGTFISVNDSTNAKVNEFKIYGKSEQKTTTGKNLLSISKEKIILSSGGYVFGSMYTEISHIPSGSYNLCFDAEYTDVPQYSLKFIYDDDTNLICTHGSALSSKLTIPLTFAKTVTKIEFYINKACTVKNIMLLKNNVTDFSYEPYTGGISSPNPNYPQEIISIENPAITLCGKNLLKTKTLKESTMNGITFTPVFDDFGRLLYVNANGTNSTTSSARYEIVLNENNFNVKNEIYKVSGGHSGNVYVEYQYINNGKNVKVVTSNSSSVTDLDLTTIDFDKEICAIYVRANTKVDNVKLYPMICSTNTADNVYEPYYENTSEIPYVLRSIGDTKDELIISSDGTGQFIQRINEIVLDGSSDENYYISGNTMVYFECNDLIKSSDYINLVRSNQFVSFHDVSEVYTNANSIAGYVDNNNSYKNKNWIYFNNGITDVDTLRSTLQQKPVKVQYVLSTPIIIDLDCKKICEMLKTYKSTTNIANDYDTEMEVSYFADNGIVEYVNVVSDEIYNAIEDKNMLNNASGNIISLENSATAPIQELKVFGKSSQVTTTGKNLLSNFNVTDTGGLTVVDNKRNGVFVLSGSVSDTAVFRIFGHYKNPTKRMILETGTYEIFATLNDIIIDNFSTEISDGTAISIKYGTTFTITDETFAVSSFTVGLPAGNYENAILKVMIVKSGQSNDFEQYTGGLPSPNPDYPQEVINVVNPTVLSVGKNLLKSVLQTTTRNGVTCTYNNDGTYTLNGAATANADFILFGIWGSKDTVVKSGTYKASFTDTSANGLGMLLVYDTKLISTIYTEGEFTAPNGISYVVIRLYQGNTVTNKLIKPMITSDLSATYNDFIPCENCESTMQYTLRSIDDVKDELIINADGTGRFIQRIKNITADDVLSLASKADLGTTYRFNIPVSSYSIGGTKKAYCNILSHLPNYSADSEHFYVDNLLVLFLNKERLADDTLETLKAYLSSVNFNVVYEMSSPIITELTSQQVQELFGDLRTYKKLTTITNSHNADMEIKYFTDNGVGEYNRIMERKIADLSAIIADLQSRLSALETK